MHASLSHITIREALANRMGPYMLPYANFLSRAQFSVGRFNRAGRK
jgi:hypothetical protein